MGEELLKSEAVTSLVGDKNLQAMFTDAKTELLSTLDPSKGAPADLKASLAKFEAKFPELTRAIHNSGFLSRVPRPSPKRRPAKPSTTPKVTPTAKPSSKSTGSKPTMSCDTKRGSKPPPRAHVAATA